VLSSQAYNNSHQSESKDVEGVKVRLKKRAGYGFVNAGTAPAATDPPSLVTYMEPHQHPLQIGRSSGIFSGQTMHNPGSHPIIAAQRGLFDIDDKDH
jgi:phenylpropionate dioxygenase-like ring-hydroxylating dioxygenase large terminal subunit